MTLDGMHRVKCALESVHDHRRPRPRSNGPSGLSLGLRPPWPVETDFPSALGPPRVTSCRGATSPSPTPGYWHCGAPERNAKPPRSASSFDRRPNPLPVVGSRQDRPVGKLPPGVVWGLLADYGDWGVREAASRLSGKFARIVNRSLAIDGDRKRLSFFGRTANVFANRSVV